MAGLFVGDILTLIFRPTLFSSFFWMLPAVLLFYLSIKISRRFSIVLAIIAGVIFILPRATSSLVTNQQYLPYYNKDVTIHAKILKDPEISEGKINLTLSDVKIDDASLPGLIFTQLTSLKTDSDFTLDRSDFITLSGTLTEGFGNFSAALFRPKVLEISRGEPGDLFVRFRNFFATKIRAVMPETESGLAIGYLLGSKTTVDKSIQETLRLIGLTHIIVASGAHLAVLVDFARKLFGKVSRFASLLFAIIFMLVFLGITGLSPSMIRASLVTICSLLAWYVGRDFQPLKLLLFVIGITLFYDPTYPTNLAWLLSFGSFFGIMILSPAITKLLYPPDQSPGFIMATIISSLSATLICGPILLYFFGSISLISIFANLFILPTISITMVLALFSGILACIFMPLASLIGQLTTMVIDYQIYIAELFAKQTMFIIKLPPENPLVFSLLLAPLAILIFSWYNNKAKHIRACSSVD